MKAAQIASLAFAALLPFAALAGINIEATTVENWPTVAGKIGLVPATCPPQFDCAALNSRLVASFKTRPDIEIVPPERVSQVMLELEIEKVDRASVRRLADALGVQSLFLTSIDYSGSDFGDTPFGASHGSVAVRVVNSDGKTLAKASGFGESPWRNQSQVAANTFVHIFKRLFGPAPKG